MCIETYENTGAKLAKLNKMFESYPTPIKNLVKLIRTDSNGCHRVRFYPKNLIIFKKIFSLMR